MNSIQTLFTSGNTMAFIVFGIVLGGRGAGGPAVQKRHRGQRGVLRRRGGAGAAVPAAARLAA